MAKLLKNVGAQLEICLATEPKITKYKEPMDAVYASLKVVKDDPSMGKRERFMLEDIFELRQKWIREACRVKNRIPSTSTVAPVVKSFSIKTQAKSVTADNVKNSIITALDEFVENKSTESLYQYFNTEVISTDFSYLLIPSIFRYCLEKNKSPEETEGLASVLCDFGEFIRSDHKVLAKGIENLLNVLGDVEDATERVLSQFSSFMSVVLSRLNFSITAEFVNCLIELKDYDAFCSLKEKKKFGVPALYFVSTLSTVYKHNPEQAKVMLSNAGDFAALFNNEEQRKALYDMYGISAL